MSFVIGCPIYRRAWIVERWYEHAVMAAERVDVEPTFLLVGDPVSDSETFDALRRVIRHDLVIVDESESGAHDGSRDWNLGRYDRMVFLRNRLLETVRKMDPLLFLSLDSDILLHENAILVLLEASGQWDAVGGKTYMTPSGDSCPSWAMLPRFGGLRRCEALGTFAVDVIMAIKLMNRRAYHIDYVSDHQGEDIGWSKAARAAGVTLGWTGAVASKHVMSEDQLNRIDERCGF